MSETRPTASIARLVAQLAILSVAGLVAWALYVGGSQNQWLGGVDDANVILVAQNLLAGKGFSLDCLIYYSSSYPQITHPEDSFPLLHPLLVAALGYFITDLIAAGYALQAALALIYFGLLPCIVVRRRGAIAGIAFATLLFALEYGTYFDRLLNDTGATVLFAWAALELYSARASLPGADWQKRWWMGVLLACLAVLFKSSVLFFVLVLLGVLFVVGPTERRWSRTLGALALIALSQLFVLLWFYIAHGEVGMPQNALMRSLMREIATEPDMWGAWEASRTYLPHHPGAVVPFQQVVERDGMVATLVVEPLSRAYRGWVEAYWDGDVIELPWLICLALATRVRRLRKAAWVALGCATVALLIPIYSHYEERYLFPLRPVVALAATEIIVVARLATGRIRWAQMAKWISCGYLLLALVGLTGAALDYPLTVDVVALVVGGVLAVVWLWHRGHRAWRTALMLVLLVGVVGSACVRMPDGVERLWVARSERSNEAAQLGIFLEQRVPLGEALMAKDRARPAVFSRRKSVVTPYHTEDICAVARRYKVDWLLVGDAERKAQGGLGEFADRQRRIARHGEFSLYRLRCDAP